MQFSIRSKLVLAISFLVVILFSVIAFLFVQEKKLEISDDIYFNSLSFSRLVAPDVLNAYDLYLAEDGFVNFSGEIGNMFNQSDSIGRIQLVSYDGSVVYDSQEDVQRRFEGAARLANEEIRGVLRSENYGIKTVEGRTLFLKSGGSGYWYLDANEESVDPLGRGELLEFIVVPVNEQFSVVFYLDYEELNERVALMVRRISYLAAFGILLGLILSFVMSEQVTRPVNKLVTGVKKVADGDFTARVDIKTHDEIQYLGESFNQMAKDLEASIEARVYKERVTRELELARQIQEQILPDVKNLPKVNGLDLAASLQSAEEIGGDIYDFLKVDDNRMLFYLGDVTGHGVPAGIVSSIASALFYGYSNDPDLLRMMVSVNRVLKEKTMPTMFLTLCLLYWDFANANLQYISAGHEQIVHYRAKEGDVVLEPMGGVALGMLPDISTVMKLQKIDFQVGDVVVVYSDGIPEAWGPNDELFGMERLLEAVKELSQDQLLSAEAIMNNLLKKVQEFGGGHKQMDDITVVVAKRV